jgi:two-component system, LuxR family, response regulator FixJ
MPPRKQRFDNDPANNAAASAPEDRGPEAVVTKVHVVDDDPISRKLLQRLVEAGGWRAEVYESAENFLAALHPDGPGCVLLDMRMPGMNGLECLREIKRRDAILSVVMVTAHGEVELAVEAMKNGALDFLEKPVTAQRVLEAVRAALDLSWEAYGVRRDRTRRERSLARLTPRERQVLDRIVRGEINKSVAKRLGISEKTVEVHRSRVMSKLDAKSLADLIRIVRGEKPAETDEAGAPAAVVLPLKARAGFRED